MTTGSHPRPSNDPAPHVISVNVATARPNPDTGSAVPVTGIDKRPVERIEVFAPGPKASLAGSGVRGDFIGDRRSHGGDAQAVYAVARADLDHFEGVLGRPLANGWMGENLTVVGLNPEQAVVGERWLVGSAELQVTCPRIPCQTFQGWAGRSQWVRDFTRTGLCGTYLSVVRPGEIGAGDPIEVVSVPRHGVRIQELFWALTIRRDLAARVLEASEFLGESDRDRLQRRETMTPS